jgi:hypothetical protein
MHKKGASPRNIFIYLASSLHEGAAAGHRDRLPGLEFSLVRTLVTLPLFIAIGYFMEWYLKDKHFQIYDGENAAEKKPVVQAD